MPGGLLLLVGSAWDLPYETPPSLAPGRRLEVALRRLGRQALSALDRRHRFDVVRQPRVLTEGYVPDADAVHVAQSHAIARFLQDAGLTLLEHRTLPHRPDPPDPAASCAGCSAPSPSGATAGATPSSSPAARGRSGARLRPVAALTARAPGRSALLAR